MKTTTDHPSSTTGHPMITTSPPKTATDNPKTTTGNPKISAGHPNTTITTVQPKITTTGHPNAVSDSPKTTGHPNAVTDPSNLTTTHSQINTGDLNVTTDPPKTTTDHPNTSTNLPTTTPGKPSTTTTSDTFNNRSAKSPNQVLEYSDYGMATTSTSSPLLRIHLEESFENHYKQKQKEMVDLYDRYGATGARKILLGRLSMHKDEEPTMDDEKYVTQMLFAALTQFHNRTDAFPADSANSTNLEGRFQVTMELAITTPPPPPRPVYHNTQKDTKLDDIDEEYEEERNRYSKDTVTFPDYQPPRKVHLTTKKAPFYRTTITTHRPRKKVSTVSPITSTITTQTSPLSTTQSPPPTQATTKEPQPETRSLLLPIQDDYSSESQEHTGSPMIFVQEQESFLSEYTPNLTMESLEAIDSDDVLLVLEPNPPETYPPNPTDSLETLETDVDFNDEEVPLKLETKVYPPKPKMDMLERIDYASQTESVRKPDTTSAIPETSTVRKIESGSSAKVSTCPTVAELFKNANAFWEKLKQSKGVLNGIELVWDAVVKSVKTIGHCLYQVAVEIFLQFLSGTPILDIFGGKGRSG